MRYQCAPSALTAIEAWVLRSSGRSLRALRHTGHPQFHCGTPPPAAAPRTTTRSMIRLLEITLRGGSQADTVSVVRKPVVTERSTCAERKLTNRLLAGSAHIHVDFHATGHFDDLGGFPGHFGSPFRETRTYPPSG